MDSHSQIFKKTFNHNKERVISEIDGGGLVFDDDGCFVGMEIMVRSCRKVKKMMALMWL